MVPAHTACSSGSKTFLFLSPKHRNRVIENQILAPHALPLCAEGVLWTCWVQARRVNSQLWISSSRNLCGKFSTEARFRLIMGVLGTHLPFLWDLGQLGLASAKNGCSHQTWAASEMGGGKESLTPNQRNRVARCRLNWVIAYFYSLNVCVGGRGGRGLPTSI